jgi:hypothetical protein
MSFYITKNWLQQLWYHIKDRLLPETVEDYVIERNKINGWTYQKWKSGMIELWIDYFNTKNFTSGITNNVQILIYKDTDNFTLYSPMQCFVVGGLSGHSSSHTEYAQVNHSSVLSPTPSVAGYYLDTWFYSSSNYSNVHYWVRAYCVSRWKE